ncbi:hypothetical protein TRFO_36542 [Tritrichomonas foetus]|uniref:Uncharacterized protein n=1 Tax=Tritrichomonas foetus TaxID=1144522 RepID=A0A1J4JG66_9EUKA|nr:hypothetical protein TRFO_36542 [Tritrichomonas foetus]|eukprot:OHS97303.1 hypothetical protein TRFO_36542 [Tritrichomonas foetus]
MQRAHSINISSLSMIRRASIAVPQEVETFKKRVSSLSKEEKPDRCIHYFMKHFDSLSDSKLQTYGISSETARLVRHAWTFIDEYLSDMQKAIQIFQFLNSAIRIYLSAARTDQCFFKIIIRIAQTDDNDMIEAAIPFIQSALLKNELQKVFFSGQNLSSIWSNVFVKNINACLNLGPIFNSFASSYSITDVTVLLQLCEKVIEDLENNAVDPSSASSAFLFLGYMIRNTNTGDFLPSILERIREISLEVDNFQFFEPFIMAPTSDPPAIWSAIDSILADPQLPLELIESALLAIHNTGVPPSPEVFSFNSFIPRMFELDDNLQKKLFDVIGQSEKETKADFFYYVMPLSQSGINTEYLEKVSNGIIWGDFLLENIIQKFFIEPGLEEIQLCLVSDSHVFDIASDFIAQLPKFTPCATDLFNIFSELVLSGEETIEPLLKLMMMKADPSLYMNEIIANISMAYENDAIMNIYSEVCLNVLNFTEVFLQTENALESIPFFCEKSSGLDFLAALVVDGPIPKIDDFFSEHYHETTLNRLNREELTKLINGLSQNPQKRRLPQQQTIGSQSRLQNILRNTIINNQQHGFMRIPSLCPYIENIILETPVDQYIQSNYLIFTSFVRFHSNFCEKNVY